MSSEEWFDIYDEEMRPIGQATREETHRLGHWHVTFHCWLYELRDGVPYVIFQRRQQGKDTNPLCYDITVAGHLSAGEKLQDAVREIEEEIGIRVSFAQLTPIMDIKEDARGEVRGKPYWDRELSHVFALHNPAAMQSWRLQPDEVMAIYAAPLHELKALFNEQEQEHKLELSVAGFLLDSSNQLIPDVQRIKAQHFVPREALHYLNVLNAIEAIVTR